MTRFTGLVIIFIFCLCMDPIAVRGQGFGSAGNSSERAGNPEGTWHPAGEAPLLPPENALNFITIDGTADIRVAPEGVRVVLAITSEGETADSCQEKNTAQVQAVLKGWADLRIAKENIVEDFISVLPVYEWRQTTRDGEQFRVQQRQGYRMQTNLHVSVDTEADAMAAINRAFKQGVTDIVTFDYWSSQLDEQKVKARAAAIEAAKAKSKILLAVFAEPPKVINIQESTAVFLPHSLYRTYENALEEQIQFHSNWNNIPAIKAFRPKTTYFQGLQSRSDIHPAKAALRPEIAVVSTVRLYYQSPADKTVAGKSK